MRAALTGMSGGAGLSPSRGGSEKVRRVGRAIIMVVAGLWSCCGRKGVQRRPGGRTQRGGSSGAMP